MRSCVSEGANSVGQGSHSKPLPSIPNKEACHSEVPSGRWQLGDADSLARLRRSTLLRRYYQAVLQISRLELHDNWATAFFVALIGFTDRGTPGG